MDFFCTDFRGNLGLVALAVRKFQRGLVLRNTIQITD